MKAALDAMVVDPKLLTGDTYKITFTEMDDKIVWNLIDSTTGEIKLQNQIDQSGSSSNLLIDGMQISVNNPPEKGVDTITQKNFTFTSENSIFGSQNLFRPIAWASPAYLFGNGEQGVPESKLKNVLLVVAQVLDTSNYNPNFNLADANMSYGYRYGTNFDLPAAQPNFSQFVVNKSKGFAFQDFVKGIPFSAWDVDDTLHPRRLGAWFFRK